MTTTAAPTTGSRADRVLRLRDGRMLGYAEYGDPEGRPMMMFHGLPGSRISGEIGDAPGRDGRFRIIAPDRPGMGLSDFQPNRRITHWPGDVLQLADALGLSRFAVAGVSGGGPYAAACARFIPERLTGCALVSGVGPFEAPGATSGMSRMNRMLFRVSKYPLPFARVIMAAQARMATRSPDRLFAAMEKMLPPADAAIVRRPEVREAFERDFQEAVRHGTRGVAQESQIVARPWGFRLEDISIKVHVWQGGRDVNVPPSMGRYQASVIPGAELHFYEDEGHLLVVDRMPEIAEAILD